MAITPKTAAQELIDEVDLTGLELRGYASDADATVLMLVERAQQQAAVRTRQRVGAANYASTDATTDEELTVAEHALACHVLLRFRLTLLSSRPEEAPPAEYIDLGALQVQIAEYLETWETMIAPYVTEDMDKPGTGFAFGSKGVDETEADRVDDDYVDRDFGSLPSTVDDEND